MIKESEMYKEEDKIAAEKINAKNTLENSAYRLRTMTTDEEKSSKLTDEDKETLEKVSSDVLSWLDINVHASKEEYEAKLKEMEEVSNPIVQKVYQQPGGQAGGVNMPEGMNFGPGVHMDPGVQMHNGPPPGDTDKIRVEEVD